MWRRLLVFGAVQMKRFATILLFFTSAATAEESFVDYVVENGASIPDPLVDVERDKGGGAVLFSTVGCGDCHIAAGMTEGPAIGPDLSGVSERLTTGEIRLMIVNPTILNPETEMPAYYAAGVLGEAPEELVGRTRLSAEEVERLVEWLSAPAD